MPARLASLTAMLLALASPALAQNDDQYRCYTTSDPRCSGDFCGNTFYNPTVSANWQHTVQNADRNVMRKMSGIYYGEQTAPALGMIERVYRSYEAGGLWQYQDETCGNTPGVPCSHNQGAGQWAAYLQGDGSIFLMVHFSDLSRTNNCFSQTVRFSGGAMVDEYGARWQKVR